MGIHAILRLQISTGGRARRDILFCYQATGIPFFTVVIRENGGKPSRISRVSIPKNVRTQTGGPGVGVNANPLEIRESRSLKISEPKPGARGALFWTEYPRTKIPKIKNQNRGMPRFSRRDFRRTFRSKRNRKGKKKTHLREPSRARAHPKPRRALGSGPSR